MTSSISGPMRIYIRSTQHSPTSLQCVIALQPCSGPEQPPGKKTKKNAWLPWALHTKPFFTPEALRSTHHACTRRFISSVNRLTAVFLRTLLRNAHQLVPAVQSCGLRTADAIMDSLGAQDRNSSGTTPICTIKKQASVFTVMQESSKYYICVGY